MLNANSCFEIWYDDDDPNIDHERYNDANVDGEIYNGDNFFLAPCISQLVLCFSITFLCRSLAHPLACGTC